MVKAAWLTAAVAWFATAAYAEDTAPKEWIDRATGHRVVRLSTEPGTRSLYFHQYSVTPDGRFVIASSPKGIVAIEIATRANKVLVAGNDKPLFVGRKTGLVYFARTAGKGVSEQQLPTKIFTVPATGGTPKQVAQIERGIIGSVNADETLLLGTFAEREFTLRSNMHGPAHVYMAEVAKAEGAAAPSPN